MSTFSSTIVYDIFDQKDDPITVTVNFGFNQLSSTLVRLNMDDQGSHDNNFTLNPGSNKFMNEKQLVLFTTISDINPDSDQVSMEVIIEGGKKPFQQTVVDSTVPSNGVISGIVSILFI